MLYQVTVSLGKNSMACHDLHMCAVGPQRLRNLILHIQPAGRVHDDHVKGYEVLLLFDDPVGQVVLHAIRRGRLVTQR